MADLISRAFLCTRKPICAPNQPDTVLRWQRILIKHFWTFREYGKKRGRKPVDKEIKDLILRIKNENVLWGVKKIQGELIKLNIVLDSKTTWNILQGFRKRGKLKPALTWKKFLQMQRVGVRIGRCLCSADIKSAPWSNRLTNPIPTAYSNNNKNGQRKADHFHYLVAGSGFEPETFGL
jgi:hypothetical protein